MNKKANFGGFLILMLILFAILSAITQSNPYNTFMNDCEKLYKGNYSYIGTCEDHLFGTGSFNCTKIDQTGLEKYCFNLYEKK